MSDALAVVLRTTDYGESDRVVLLLVEGRGKVACFARAARKSQKRFGGALEPFTLVRARLRERTGAELLGLDSATLVEPFAAIRGELSGIARAAYAAELARELLRDREPADRMLAALLRYLRALDAGGAGAAAMRAFELEALSAAGLQPELQRCARCGEAVEGPAPLDPEAGGVVCRRDARGGASVSPRALAALRAAQRGESVDEGAAREARRAVREFIAWHLHARLKALAFMEQVGADP